MLLSDRRLLFVHVPKTGGNSVQNALSPWSDDEKVTVSSHQDGAERFEVRNKKYDTTKHSTLNDYCSEYPESLFRALYKVSAARNTYERILSFYFSPHRGKVEWDRTEFRAFVESVPPLRHYWQLGKQSLSEAVGNLDRLLWFESLNADHARLAAEFDLPQSLGHRNKGPGRSRANEYYDRELAEFVTQRFAEEIEFFNFKAPI